jgi:DNA-dependent protein kinase catalytic subunit
MFLGWVPQILVNVDTQKVSAIGPLIIRIANTYPQAVMFAYRLSKENYNCENMESINLIKKLDEILLGDERVDNFLSALSYVGIPASILLYYVRKIKKACHLGNFTDIRSIQKHVLKQFFNCKPDSRDVSLMQGNMFKKIVKYEKDFKSLEGLLSNASNASKKIMDKLQKVESELVEMLLDSHEVKRYSGLLKDYSPWLANLSACKLNFDLEIPGQYSGNRLPLVQHHVKISSFCPNIIVMSSLRKPIKITILGNDSREYPFLIKFGEDIRQDQRIQQIFSLMNNIFSSDTSVSGRELSILTYQVIPLTTNLGIIQWIDKTNSLQDFVKKSLIDTKSYGEAFDSYHKWIYKSSNQQDVDAYGRAATTYSRDKTIPKFRSLVSTVEWDIFRSTFLKLSTNNESFFILRNNFIKSYAVMCVSHWILGVGDRHLSNTLVCLKDGKVLGIDFGHAFGTATQILPVPELVPFRLTPHLVNLMQPLGEKGLFKEIMIHCLRSLRSNSGSLLATMNVFIEEPSLDWLEHASRFSGGTDSANCNWYPAQKIDQAKRKLLGTSSTTILIEDLKAGHQRNEKYMKAYIKLVEGAPDYDLRARMNGDNLSVEDQVDCLIDHATDYNLLGRMFHGWAAWI